MFVPNSSRWDEPFLHRSYEETCLESTLLFSLEKGCNLKVCKFWNKQKYLYEERLDPYLMFIVWVSFNLQINKSTRKAKAKNCTFLYVCIWHLLTLFSKLLCTTIDRISISNLTKVIIIWIFSLLLIFELEFWNYIVRVTFLKFLLSRNDVTGN